ncbi:MAG: IS1634 family transposase [Candidatus Omnitrophica bacterium]|nr:IS1634 family transposase [Candidatus Omnitrophota bacterium]
MFARIKKSGKYEYLQLVENRRHKDKITQRVIATMGRLDVLQQSDQLEKTVQSLTKFCNHALLLVSNKTDTVKSNVISIGPSLIFDRLWKKSGIEVIVKELLKGRRYGFDVERAIYFTVLHRLFNPGSDRAAQQWKEGYKIAGAEDISLHQVYRAMAWLGEALPKPEQEGATPVTPRCIKDKIEERLFFLRRDLFSTMGVVFFDTTSLYFEGEGGTHLGARGYSKDNRPDLKQMILGVVLDGEGRPVCCELWPGNTADVKSIIPIVDRLKMRFGINRVCIVADRGMISKETITVLESNKYGFEYILGVRMRKVKKVKEKIMSNTGTYEEIFPARHMSKDPAPLKVKDMQIDNRRYVVCYNEEQARKDAHTREAIVELLTEKIKNNKGGLIGNAGYKKYVHIEKNGISLDTHKINDDAKFDGIWALQTNTTLSARNTALCYKDLWRVEKVFRDTKTLLRTRPIFHKYDETIRGHVFCSFLALVIRAELERELEDAGYRFEWAEIKRDLKLLAETEITHEGKTFVVRSESKGVCGKVFQTVGVALPPTIRQNN